MSVIAKADTLQRSRAKLNAAYETLSGAASRAAYDKRRCLLAEVVATGPFPRHKVRRHAQDLPCAWQNSREFHSRLRRKSRCVLWHEIWSRQLVILASFILLAAFAGAVDLFGSSSITSLYALMREAACHKVCWPVVVITYFCSQLLVTG